MGSTPDKNKPSFPQDNSRIISNPGEEQHLDAAQLNLLELSFRQWAKDSNRLNVRLSRESVLLIFLIIRYTGAKLKEVLSLDLTRDVDLTRCTVIFRGAEAGPRTVHISQAFSDEIKTRITALESRKDSDRPLDLDPGFVRRKFYERALECGFPKRLCGPEAIRKARGVELMQSNIPLPAVQMMLGHATPNLTSAYVTFSEDEIQAVTRRFLEKESGRKTSARNSFFGKVTHLVKGSIEAQVAMQTLEGNGIISVITKDSLERLGLSPGSFITAEVKAPSVMLHHGEATPECSTENRFRGVVSRKTRGQIHTEYIVKISETTEVCAVISSTGNPSFELKVNDHAWVLFSSSSVVLRVD
jgi:molybdate transport system regulatory protein